MIMIQTGYDSIECNIDDDVDDGYVACQVFVYGFTTRKPETGLHVCRLVYSKSTMVLKMKFSNERPE